MRHGHKMRRTLIAGLFTLLAFVTVVSLPGTAKLGLGGPAMAQDGFAIDQFYDELAPFGEWVHHPRHNYVWLPRSVPEGWRPYTIGHWVSTEEYGWYWESQEPFAWAVYHYGRWGYEAGYGWYWVPGDTWAPAWVQWRYGTDYVGWAPVGPSPYGGYAYGGQTGYAPPPAVDSWVFVRQAYLTSNVLYRHVLPRVDVTIALNRTTYVVRPQFRNGHVYNYGMPRHRWSQITRQHIKPRKIHRGHGKARPHGWNGRHGRDLYAYAPNVRKGVKPRRAPKRVHHRPPKAKAKAKHNGKHYGRAATTQAPRYRAGHKALPRKATARPGVVYPGRRGPGWGVANPRVRPKAGGGKRKVFKPHPSKSKAAIAKANKAKAAKARANKAKANKAKAKSAKSRNAKAAAARSKAARSKTARAKAARAKTGARNAAKARDARAKTAKAKSAKSQNAKAAKGKAARPKTAKAKAAKSKAAKARPPKMKTAKAKPAKSKAGKSKAGKSKPAKSKAGKSKTAKPKAGKSRAASAKPGAGHGGHGKGKKGGRRG